MVDVAHDGHDGRTRTQVLLALFLFLLEVLGLELGLLLLTGVDETDLRADLGGEQLDHVVAQRLGGGHHLALEEQEPDHVAGGAVELGPELAGRRAPLHDDLEVGHRGVRRRVGGELRRLELLEVATSTAGPALGGPTSPAGTAAQAGRRRATAGATTESATTAGATTESATTAAGPPRPGGPPPGTRATHAGSGTGSGPAAGARRARGGTPTGGRRDGSAVGTGRTGGRRDGSARRAHGRTDPGSGRRARAPVVTAERRGPARRPGRMRPRPAVRTEPGPRADVAPGREPGGPPGPVPEATGGDGGGIETSLAGRLVTSRGGRGVEMTGDGVPGAGLGGRGSDDAGVEVGASVEVDPAASGPVAAAIVVGGPSGSGGGSPSRLLLGGLLGLDGATKSLAVGLAPDAVGLGVLDRGRVALDPDAQRHAEVEGLLVRQAELTGQLVDAYLLRQGLLRSFLFVRG